MIKILHAFIFSRILIAITLAHFLLFGSAQARTNFTDQDLLVVAMAENAMNAIRSAQGRFVQLDAQGIRAEGSLYVERPGKLRFEYDAPSPIMVIADGQWIMQVDRELEEVVHQNIKRSILYFLLDDYVDFTKGVDLIDVVRLDEVIMITIQRQNMRDDGYLTLYIDPLSYVMKGWQTLDNQGRRVTVELNNMLYGQKQPAELFELPNSYGRDLR